MARRPADHIGGNRRADDPDQAQHVLEHMRQTIRLPCDRHADRGHQADPLHRTGIHRGSNSCDQGRQRASRSRLWRRHASPSSMGSPSHSRCRATFTAARRVARPVSSPSLTPPKEGATPELHHSVLFEVRRVRRLRHAAAGILCATAGLLSCYQRPNLSLTRLSDLPRRQCLTAAVHGLVHRCTRAAP